MKNKLSSFITTVKIVGISIFYWLAILGIIDLIVNLITGGEVKLIQMLLNNIIN